MEVVCCSACAEEYFMLADQLVAEDFWPGEASH